jgi:hypothetical protein
MVTKVPFEMHNVITPVRKRRILTRKIEMTREGKKFRDKKVLE